VVLLIALLVIKTTNQHACTKLYLVISSPSRSTTGLATLIFSAIAAVVV
jgi:hypothetical protein